VFSRDVLTMRDQRQNRTPATCASIVLSEQGPLNPIARSFGLDSLPRSVSDLSELAIGLSSAGTVLMYLAFCTGGSFLLSFKRLRVSATIRLTRQKWGPGHSCCADSVRLLIACFQQPGAETCTFSYSYIEAPQKRRVRSHRTCWSFSLAFPAY
jgi:hypothetical protein